MSFARGFIKGFIGQSLDKKAAADEALADLNNKVSERYLTDILPNFTKSENNIEKRFNLIEQKYDKPTALYALSNKLTDTDYGFRQIMDLDDSDATKLQNYTKTIDFGNYNFEQAKTEILKVDNLELISIDEDNIDEVLLSQQKKNS